MASRHLLPTNPRKIGRIVTVLFLGYEVNANQHERRAEEFYQVIRLGQKRHASQRSKENLAIIEYDRLVGTGVLDTQVEGTDASPEEEASQQRPQPCSPNQCTRSKNAKAHSQRRKQCYTKCMSDYATKQDVQEIVQKAIATDVQKIVDKAVTDLSEIIANFAQQVDERFNQNEAAIHALDTRLTRVEERLDDLDRKFDRLLATMDRFIARLDNIETNDLARDAQFERLLAWAKKVSKKTGIPLEGF